MACARLHGLTAGPSGRFTRPNGQLGATSASPGATELRPSCSGGGSSCCAWGGPSPGAGAAWSGSPTTLPRSPSVQLRTRRHSATVVRGSATPRATWGLAPACGLTSTQRVGAGGHDLRAPTSSSRGRAGRTVAVEAASPSAPAAEELADAFASQDEEEYEEPEPEVPYTTLGGGAPKETEVHGFERFFAEEAKRYGATIFTDARWSDHVSQGRYWRHIVTLTGSRIWMMTRGLVTYATALALALAAYRCVHGLPDAHALAPLRAALPAWAPPLAVPTQIMDWTTFALSLLLVFRTNASYERWKTGLALWARVLAHGRSLMLKASRWGGRAEPRRVDALLRWAVAFAQLLLLHLRSVDVSPRHVRGLLRPGPETRAATGAPHAPLLALRVLGGLLDGLLPRLSEAQGLQLENHLNALGDALAEAERLHHVPIPLAYTRHSSRFMVAWLTALPFALVSTAGWAGVAVTAGVAFLLLGIEQIGVQIEMPFDVLPLRWYVAQMHLARRAAESPAGDERIDDVLAAAVA